MRKQFTREAAHQLFIKGSVHTELSVDESYQTYYDTWKDIGLVGKNRRPLLRFRPLGKSSVTTKLNRIAGLAQRKESLTQSTNSTYGCGAASSIMCFTRLLPTGAALD